MTCITHMFPTICSWLYFAEAKGKKAILQADGLKLSASMIFNGVPRIEQPDAAEVQ